MTFTRGSLVALCLIFAASCTTTQPVSGPRAIWCATNEPLPRLPAIAVAALSRADKERLVAYQLKGQAWCGWEVP